MATTGSEALVPWVVFRLHGQEYALAVTEVVEVLRMAALTSIPEAPPAFAGLLNLRGRGVAVLDLAARLGLPRRLSGPEAIILIVRAENRDFGLIVEEVTEIRLPPDEAPAPPGGTSPLIAAIAHVEGRTILELDLERVLDA